MFTSMLWTVLQWGWEYYYINSSGWVHRSPVSQLLLFR